MITATQIRNAEAAVTYFGRELGTSDYYLAQKGVWYGKGARILGLAPEVKKEDFVAIVNNRAPGSDERLTARNNTTRTRVVWKAEEVTQTKVPLEEEISNRRVCLDFTFSVPKSISMYLARTKDAEVEELIHQALRETMDDMELAIQTRVRVDGADQDRSTGNALWACFVHRTTRPVSGKVDPHWHCHALLMNATYDSVEDRWKAAQLGEVISSKGFYQAAFHSRLAEKLMAAGHRLRRTGKDFEMDVFTEEEVRVFCKRTQQIEDLEKRLRDELEKKAEARVRAAAKRGELLDYEETYAAEKAKLGSEYREAKNQAKLQGAALEADWGSQLAPGRWNAITPQASKLGHSIGFLDHETAQVQAIHHAFEQHSTIRERAMMTELLKWGIGVIPVRMAERFVRESAAFLRNLADPGSITTQAVYREEKKILSMIQAGQGTLAPIDSGNAWKIQSQKIAAEPGQADAVRHVLGSTDLLTGIAGKPGVGKTTVIRETADAIRSLSGQEPMMLAATASAVARLKESGMLEATTVANFKVKSELQAMAAGRVIWCDEASLLDNADMTWLLNFARDNGSRLVVSGDPRQHGAVQRGHPFKMAIDTQVLPCAKLQKIYRQQNAPQLLEIIEDYYAQRYDAALQKIEGLGLIRESNTRSDSLQALVADVIEEFKRGQNPLVISPIHRDGKAFAQSLRASMKAEGMLGQEDHEVEWLESVDLSAAQQRDLIYYEPGQIIEFHRQREKGGFRCGDHWEVTRREDQAVFVAKDGKERQLPLHLAQDFNVYRAESMPVAVGERVLITKNNRKASLTNGDLLEVKAIDQTGILLENGRRLERSKPLHIRQGYTITSQTSQGHERAKMFGFLPVSATSQINAVQMLVSLSRASQEVRLYTDSTEVLKEVAIRPGQGRSAVELIDGVAMPRNGSSTGHDGKELAQELDQKDPSLSSTQEPPLEKEIQEAVRQSQKTVEEYITRQPYHPPPPPKHDRTREPGISRGF